MTDDNTTRPLKVILCGTNYGASYIPAIRAEASSFELVGILASGSERSIKLAAANNVPLWSSAEQIAEKGSVDVAVIALPPAAAASVAKQLIRRGIHLLVEHPVAIDVLQDVRQQASEAKVTHNVNCHFAELTAPRAFVQECRRRFETKPPQYASVVTAARSAYATFDLLGRALGGMSGAVLHRELTSTSASSSQSPAYPFASFRGTVCGVPVRVQCSEAVASVDDGSDSPIPQRIEIGSEEGNLMMLGPAGPVVWSEKLRLALRHHPGPLWINVAGEGMTFMDLMKDRVNANRRALDEIYQQIRNKTDPPAHQSTDWLTHVADLMTTVRSESKAHNGT